MNISEALSVLITYYEPEIREMITSRDKFPAFTIDLMSFLDYSPSESSFLLHSPSTSLQDLFQSILSAQYTLYKLASTSFTINLYNSPLFYSKLKPVFTSFNKLLTISPLYIKSLSQTSSFISKAEYVCKTCCESFSYSNDLTWGNSMSPPYKCRVFTERDVPQSRVLRCSFDCTGTSFDLLEGSYVYSDYQELVVSDGKSEILVILQGNLCNSARIGECVEITGVYTQRWNQHNDAEYAFVCYSILICPSSIVKTGISAFREHLLEKNEFDIRQSIIRSSFGGIYGNYHIKYALILNIIAHLCGLTFSSLIIGDISTGKSSISKLLTKLFPSECKLINGALTNAKSLSQQTIMNFSTGKFESGLFDSTSVLVIDNFETLPDKKILYKAMESKSVIAMVEVHEDTKEFSSDISKNKKLASDYDRFDIILNTRDYGGNEEFRIKKLANCEIEAFKDIWDFDTIKEYLNSNLRDHREIKINSEKVESLMQKFIEYVITYNLKNCNACVAGGISVRLLESLIKIAKANAILMRHEEVLICDAVDAILVVGCGDVLDAFVDIESYRSAAGGILNNIELCCGKLEF